MWIREGYGDSSCQEMADAAKLLLKLIATWDEKCSKVEESKDIH
jgi:hypothetical protein